MRPAEIKKFQSTVWEYYQGHGRQLPWRKTTDQYKILVSEVMLQQTQVSRVIPKFEEFLREFPTVQALAAARLGDVLKAWSGLGYNRRAKYLHEAAQILMQKDGPWTKAELVALKGIGPNTAAAVIVYAYNQPLIFIETNIRTVFIHHFFATGSYPVADKELRPLLEAALDKKQPRKWFWALMDYGVHLKTTVGNASQRSQSYGKQSTFAGSNRQLRGQIIRLLTMRPYDETELRQRIDDQRLTNVLKDLEREGFLRQKHHTFELL